MWVTSSLTTALTPTAVALGNFDGVHQGHQQVIKPVLHSSDARSPAVSTQGGRRLDNGLLIDIDNDCWESDYRISASDRPLPTVVTFNPHPREFFTGQPRALLTPLDEKVELLTALGVEQLVLLPFDREMADLSPQEFVEHILVRQLKARWISVGQDFCFGNRRSGTSADLKKLAAKYGVEVTIVPIQNNEGERISSSAIRQFLLEGEVERANQLLGRPYTLIGCVIQGQQLGRTIGFPTANLELPANKFLPRFGVYAVRVSIDQAQETETALLPNTATEGNSPIVTPLRGVMNIGHRPTVNGINPTVEVHLLDWTGDLYGKTLTVSLEKFLRPEQKFASLEELKQQITGDCLQARSILS
ncbi:bifunctional riboflavin kinase/FAD synthetase [Aerosakkonemataceae cyanobacterium BLCC-F50]|uniref:Riboflavin biosynthesis protein n=1 Tax=Floridaenema flaviceps BLCC-F50 TaxID=3153642 RepID=A0ABV4Y1V2_9CYAN